MVGIRWTVRPSRGVRRLPHKLVTWMTALLQGTVLVSSPQAPPLGGGEERIPIV